MRRDLPAAQHPIGLREEAEPLVEALAAPQARVDGLQDGLPEDSFLLVVLLLGVHELLLAHRVRLEDNVADRVRQLFVHLVDLRAISTHETG